MTPKLLHHQKDHPNMGEAPPTPVYLTPSVAPPSMKQSWDRIQQREAQKALARILGETPSTYLLPPPRSMGRSVGWSSSVSWGSSCSD